MANVHVNLLFEANTQNAINNINQLGQLLNQISSKTTIGVNSGSLNQAAQAARELQVHLGNAVNVNTGKLDLTKLNTSLKQSNQSLSQLSGSLVAAGTTGQQAFAKLANSIASAQAPAFALGTTLKTMFKTMGTAMMWTVAYGAIDAMGQAFKGAIDYAKDLNKALTDIAIVSDLTEKQLADFAKTASKAAKELKTTTTAYAEAALIFYQQGLSGAEVEERANAVIKMAHVTGQTAQTVSDQMTAVWNNFDNGTKSLEYYIDVLTALGAATASSTDEIAQGLEKFMAVAETVGLSYEYATTALATVTAQTRQSADVVGTAFKTLFARIQDLELGKTLEDGVTLGQYSEALAKIGVSALDAKGNLRDMDDILNDMGAKWNTLTKAQQTATAQSVAGVRQYTQLIALMDNWDEFEVNLKIAEDSEGTLEEQNEKWAKSAEAAAEEVKEAWNSVYSEILDDDTVIGFTKGFATLLSTIGNALEALGGLGPMLLMLAGIFSGKLIPVIQTTAQHIAQNFKIATGKAAREVEALKTKFQSEMQQMANSPGIANSSLGQQLQATMSLMEVKSQYEQISKRLVGTQQQEYQQRMLVFEAIVQETQGLIQENAENQKNLELSEQQLTSYSSLAKLRANAKKIDVENLERLNQQEKDLLASLQQTNQQKGTSGKALTIGMVRTEEKLPDQGSVGRGNVQVTKNAFQKAAKNIGAVYNENKGVFTAGASVDSLEKTIKASMEYEQIATKLKNTNIDVKNSFNVLVESENNKINSNTKLRESLVAVQSAEQKLQAIENDSTLSQGEKEQRQKAATEELRQAKEQLNVVTKQSAGITQEEISSYQTALQVLDQAEQQFNELIGTIPLTDTQLKKVNESFARLRSGTGTRDDITTVSSALASMGNIADFAQSELSELGGLIAEKLKGQLSPEAVDKFVINLVRAGHSSEAVKEKLRQVGIESDLLKDKFRLNGQVLATSIQGIASVAGSLAMGINSIKMAINALTSDDMSGWEKFSTILMSLSMLLPLTATVIKAVTAEESKNSVIIALNSIARWGNKKAIDAQNKSTAVQNSELNVNNTKTDNNTLKQLGQSFGKAAPKLLLIAAAIAVIVAVIKIAEAQINKNEDRLKSATQQAAHFNKELEEATSAQEEFNSTVSDYKDARDGIAGLTKGTIEYKEAVLKANQQAIELLKNNENLKYTIGEGGLIKIDDGSLAAAQEEQLNKVLNAQLNSAVAQTGQSRIESKDKTTDFAREHLESSQGSGQHAANIGSAAAAAAGAGALIGIALPVIGPAIGAAVGAAVGAIGGAIATGVTGTQSDKETEALELLVKNNLDKPLTMFATDNELREYLKGELDLNDTALINSMVENREALQEYTETMIKATKEQQANWIQAYSNFNTNNQAFQDAQSQKFMALYALNNNAGEKERKEAEGKFEDLLYWGDEDAADYALKQIYGDEASNYRYTDLANGYWTLQKKNEEGAWETVGEENSIAEEDIKAQIGEKAAIQGASSDESLEEATKRFNELKNSFEALGITDKDRQNVLAESFAEAGEEAISLTEALNGFEIANLNINSIADEKLREAVEKSKEAYLNSTEIDDWIKKAKNQEWYNSLSDKEKELVWTMKIDKEDSLNQVKDLLEEAKVLAANTEVQLKLTTSNKLLDLLKDGIADDEWSKYFDYIKKLFNDGQELTHEQQVEWAKKSREEIKRELENNSQDLIEESYDLINDTQQAATQKRKRAEQDLKEAEKTKKNQQQAESDYQQMVALAENFDDTVLISGGSTSSVNQLLSSVFKSSGTRTLNNKEEAEKLYNTIFNNGKQNLLLDGMTVSEEQKSDIITLFQKNLGTNEEGMGNARLELTKIFNEIINTNIKEAEKIKNRYEAKTTYEDASTALTNAKNAELEAAKDQQRWLDNFNKENKKLGLDTEALEDYAENLREVAKTSDKVSDDLLDFELYATQVAQAVMRLNKGIKDLNDKFEDWEKILSSGNSTSAEYLKTLEQMRSAVANVLDVSSDVVDNDFLEEYWGQIKEASKGSPEAVEALRVGLARDVLLDATGLVNFDALDEDLSNAAILLENWAINNKLTIGAKLNGGDFINAANILIKKAKYTETEIRAYLNALHYDVQIGTDGLISEVMYKGPAKDTIDRSNLGLKDEKEKKKYKDEIKRYHEINEVIDDLSRQYDQLSKAKDRAFGPDKLKYLDLEKAKIEEQIAAQDKLITAMEKDLKTDRKAIAKYGASTDEYGRITNYEEMMKVNIDAYNSGKLDDEGYKKFKSDIEQYEKTLNGLEDAQQKLIDLENQRIDLGLEKVQYAVDYNIDLTKDALRVIEFELKNLTDSVDDAVTKFDLLGKKMEQAQKSMETYKQGINDAFLVEGSGFTQADVDALMAGDMSVLEGKTLTKAQVEALREYSDGLLKSTQEIIEARDSISDTLLASFKDMNQQIDKQIDHIGHLNSMTKKYRNILDLMGVEASGFSKQLLSDISKAQFEISRSTIRAERAQLEQNQAAMESIKAQLDDALARGDEAAAKELRETYDEIAKTVQKDNEALLEATAAGLEAAAALFEQEMDTIIGAFEDAMAGAYGSFSMLEESFAQSKKLADLYLDDYQKIYELSKLNRDIVKSIDESDNVAAKSKLRDLQAEINDLQESNTEMTQYEVDSLRAKYELRLAEIALEEAQNAKNQVRMTRDSEGNWGYVYTADQDAIGAAEQNYEDKLYNYQELIQNQGDELQEYLISLPREFSKALKEIYQDDTLTEEERALRIEETKEHYNQMYQHTIDQLRLVNADAAMLYNSDWLEYSKTTGYKISEDQKWVDSFDETIAAQKLGYNSLEEVQDNFELATSKMLIRMDEAYVDYRKNVNETLEAAGLDMEEFAGKLKGYLDSATIEAEEAAKAAEEMGNANKKAFKDAVDAAKQWLSKYSGKIDLWVKQNTNLAESVKGIISKYKGLGNQLDKIPDKYKAIERTARAAARAQVLVNLDNKNRETKPENATFSTLAAKSTGKLSPLFKEQPETFNLSTSSKVQASELGDGHYQINVDGETYMVDSSTYKQMKKFMGVDNFDAIPKTEYTPPAPKTLDQMPKKDKKGLEVTIDPTKLKPTGDQGSYYAYNHLGEGIFNHAWHSIESKDFKDATLVTGQPVKVEGVPGSWSEQDKKSATGKDILGRKGTYMYLVKIPGYNFNYYIPADALSPASLDTGGYTGSWDSSGRLAMLHQKELVLNAEDTVNFLDAVNIVREIAQAIDLNAVAQAMQLGNLRAATAAPTAQVLEQEVTIHAEFPNATNHSEIEEAFRNLTLTASQFANREKK